MHVDMNNTYIILVLCHVLGVSEVSYRNLRSCPVIWKRFLVKEVLTEEVLAKRNTTQARALPNVR